jgi:hypothetical protein
LQQLDELGDSRRGAGSQIAKDGGYVLANGRLFHFSEQLSLERLDQGLAYFDGKSGPFLLLVLLQGLNCLPLGCFIALIQCPDVVVELV